MKQRLKGQIWYGLSAILIVANLNLATEATAQPLHITDVVLLSQQSSNSSTPRFSAGELFRKAYENRYTWNQQFPGYTAAVVLKEGKEEYRGRIRVNPDMSVEVTDINKEEVRRFIERQLGMIVVHRREVPFEVAHKNSTFHLGTTDKAGAIQVFEQGDKTEAHYKLLRSQVKQVNRLLGPHSITVDLVDSEVTPEGYFPTRYRTTMYQPQTKQVLEEMESKDNYKKVENYYVLASQVIDHSAQGEQTTVELDFTDIQLLPGKD